MDHSRLPPELWILIIRSLANSYFKVQDSPAGLRPKSSRIDLFKISVVSRHFRRLCEPFVFDRLNIAMSDLSKYVALNVALTSILAFMRRRPEIKHWIKAIRLRGPPDRMHTTEFNNKLASIFGQLNSIESVYVSHWTILPALFSSLRIETLQEIAVESCLMDGFRSIPPLVPSSKLRSLHLDAALDTHAAVTLAPLLCSPALEYLGLFWNSRSLLSIHLQNNSHYCFDCLITLIVAAPATLPETQMFVTFAQHCSKVQSLHILPPTEETTSESSTLASRHLPPSVFPNILEFRGSLLIAHRIARDRPITRIRADGWEDAPDIITRDLLVPLMPMVPITLLHLRAEWWVEGLLGIMVDLFPALEDFSLIFRSGEFSPWSRSHFADVRRLPHLRKVQLVYAGFPTGSGDPERARHRILDTLHETNPHLRFLQLGQGRPWTRDANGQWTLLPYSA